MHSNPRMLESGGFPGDTETCRIAWKGWKVINDWNVWNVSGATGVTGVPLEGLVAGMPGMSLEGLVRHTDAFLEDLLAFYA